MSQVRNALLSQRQVWKEVSQEIIKGGLTQNLPPKMPRRILFCGEGSSYFAAKLTALTLNREWMKDEARPHVSVVACPSVTIGVETFPTRDDWVIAFSHRGKTATTLQALRQCERAGAFTVLVTARGVSGPEGEESLVKFLVPTCSPEKCEPHTVGLTSAICAVTTLFMGTTAAETWTSLSLEPDPDLEALKVKAGKGPTILLGEWEGEWIAREISLKLNEMARIQPQVFSSEAYFHGPAACVKSIGRQERIWYIAVPGDSRADQIEASYQMKVPLDHSLAWVTPLVELQWLSLAVTLNLGRDPDGRN